MSARRSGVARRARGGKNKALRCPKCKSLDVEVKDYPDAELLICQKCKFPRRVVKS